MNVPIDEISTILPNTTTADSRQGVKVVLGLVWHTQVYTLGI